MITLNLNETRTGTDVKKQEFFGLSTDTKPTTPFEGRAIANGAIFYEMNTKKVFMFDAASSTWLEQ